MTYLPQRPSTTTAPTSQGVLPGGAQSGDQVLVFRPGSGTYYVDLTSLTSTSITADSATLTADSSLITADAA